MLPHPASSFHTFARCILINYFGEKNPAVKLETLRPENNGLEGVVQRRDMGPSKTNQTNHADESRSPKNTYRHSFSMEFLSILAQIKNHQTPSILSNVLETPGNKQGVLDNLLSKEV